MDIKTLIKRNYATLDAYLSVETVRKHPHIDDGIVITEDEKVIGIINSADLARRHHCLLIDCMTSKPVVKSTEKITNVLDLIKSSGHKTLMVNDDNGFVGMISQSDLLYHLQSKIENQQQVLQAAAHDLRNPISSIRMIGALLNESLKKEENLELIAMINKTCDFAQQIVDEILITEKTFEDVLTISEEDIDELVRECIAGFSSQLGQKQISLKEGLSSGAFVRIDTTRLKRAVNNLLSNSIKFTPVAGQVTVSSFIEDDKVILSIADNGIGIPKESQEKIFDKFTTEKRTGTNGEATTGLGLFLTRQVVEMLDGKIEVNSDGVSGTCFTVKLPLCYSYKKDMEYVIRD